MGRFLTPARPPGKCGSNRITGPKAVTVDATGPHCKLMTSLLDTLATVTPGLTADKSIVSRPSST